MRKILNRLVYASHQYGRYPEALLADCLIIAYLALLIVGHMGVRASRTYRGSCTCMVRKTCL